MGFYTGYLKLSKQVIGTQVTASDINSFLNKKTCSNGGKHAYYRVLRVFYNWLYSPRSGYHLNPQDNPILSVDAPKREKRILPSLTQEQVESLIRSTECTRDKAIISLFAESGLRLRELQRIQLADIDWEHRLIRVICKGNKEALAPFGHRTEQLMKQWLSESGKQGCKQDGLWDIDHTSIIKMLQRLGERTGVKCNPHTFRRAFATILAKKGVDSLHIMRLGRWESLSMVEHYTRSIRFEDSLKFYEAVMQ